MKFSYKVFAAIFLVSISIMAVSEIAILRRVSAQAESDYSSQYRIFSQRIGDTLNQLDVVTELLMKNAAYVLRERERQKGLLSTGELKKLRDELHMFNLYITDDKGKFIRSTWTWPLAEERPLFEYCAGYRGLITGRSNIAMTPILRAPDLSWPFKFLMIPNHDRTRVLEASVAMGFVGDTLKSAIKPDGNIVSIGLFTPSGNVLGYVHSNGEKEPSAARFDAVTVPFDAPEITKSGFVFFSKVPTTNDDCCECRMKGLTLPDGKYYYVLRTEVSRASLDKKLAGIRRLFLVIGLVTLVLSAILAYVISRSLVERLARMGERVGTISRTGDWNMRLGMGGRDEVGVLAGKFDDMLARLNATQTELAEAAKQKALLSLASQVAHDIRSPLAALDSAVAGAGPLAENERVLMRDAVDRINGIANGLLNRSREQKSSADERPGVLSLSILIDPLIAEKRLEFRARSGVVIHSRAEDGVQDLRAAVHPGEFKRLLSNLINNAVEAFGDGAGEVRVILGKRDGRASVRVEDNGKGITPEIMAKLGGQGETHGKPGGSGLGLHHARTSVESWGGTLELASVPGNGTTVTVLLPLAGESTPGQKRWDAVLIDDDRLVRATWKAAAARAGKDLRDFGSIEEFFSATPAIDRSTPVYVDADLGGKVKGDRESLKIRDLGFNEIYLATGHPPEAFAGLTHLRGVVGKGSPWT